jgi:hypothetical protein
MYIQTGNIRRPERLRRLQGVQLVYEYLISSATILLPLYACREPGWSLSHSQNSDTKGHSALILN